MHQNPLTMKSVVLATLLLTFLSAVTAAGTSFTLKDSLPQSFEGSAWKPAGDHAYAPENLYNYINGAADLFISYGFIELVGREYSQGSEKKRNVTIDIYDMGTTLNAFGVFRSKRDPESTTLKIGAGAFGTSKYLFWYKDRYYVEIQAYPVENRDVLIGMAQHVEGMLPGQNAPPSELNYLPAESRVPGTEMYITGGILGHGFLDRGLVCKYLVDGEEVMAFVVFFPSAGDAGKALESYKRYLEQSGETCQELHGVGEGGLVSREPYHKTVIVARQAAFIAGVADLSRPDRGKDLLKHLLENLPQR